MSKQANPALIGGFIVGALALAVLTFVLFASGSLTATAAKNIVYFSGSINGLNIGAPVKLKGVTVGKVSDILVIFDEQNGKVLTPVIIEFEPGKIYDVNGKPLQRTSRSAVKELIDHGLRAQLQSQSLVTGQLYVEINFRPEMPARLVAGDKAEYPELPSIPSSKEQIESTIDEVIATFKKMPLEQTFNAALESILTIEKLLKSPEITSSLVTIDRTLKDLQHLLHHLEGKVDPLTADLHKSLVGSQALLETVNRQSLPLLTSAQDALTATVSTMTQARTTLSTVDQAAGQNASLDQALRDLSSAANSLRVLADYLERHPDSLLYGKLPRDR